MDTRVPEHFIVLQLSIMRSKCLKTTSPQGSKISVVVTSAAREQQRRMAKRPTRWIYVYAAASLYEILKAKAQGFSDARYIPSVNIEEDMPI